MSTSHVNAKLANHRASVSLRSVKSEEDEILRKQAILTNHRKKHVSDHNNQKTDHQRKDTHHHHQTTNASVLKRKRNPRKLPRELTCREITQYPSKYSGIGDEKSKSDGESSIDEYELDILEDQVSEFEMNISKLNELKDSVTFQACCNVFLVIIMIIVHTLLGGNSILPVPIKLFTPEYKWEYYYGSSLYNLTQIIVAPIIGNPMRNHQIFNLSEWWFA